MKRKTFLILLSALILLAGTACAELSTNLLIRKKMNPGNKKIESETYTDAAGNPVIADDKGYATVKYTYITGNKVGKTEYLDTEGNLVNNADGVAQKIDVYGVGGLTKTRYLDAEGNPVNGPEGYARKESKYIYRSHVSTWEYDKDGNPVNLHRISEHGIQDKPGLITKDGWYDAEGNPAAGPEGYAWVEYRYNGLAKVSYTAYYNADGSLFFHEKKGFAVEEYVYEHLTLRELNYYGADGQYMAGPKGFARALYSYVKRDENVVAQRAMYYNADGSLFFTDKGYCGIEQSKTASGRVTDERYFTGENQQGKNTDGYSRMATVYTRFGAISVQRFYDENDHLIVSEPKGYSIIVNTYSGRNVIETKYLDEKKQPMIGPEGYFAIRYKYDGNKQIRATYYGTDNRTLVNCAKGYARIEYERDKDKKVLKEAYFDADGNPFIIRDDANEIRYTLVSGNKTSESYWLNGEPVSNSKGYHGIRYTYTGGNKVSSQTYFDAEGNSILTKDGYARKENQYNSKGQVMFTLYYGADGKLIAAPGKEYAYVRTISTKDKDYLGEEAANPELNEEQEQETEPEEEPE